MLRAAGRRSRARPAGERGTGAASSSNSISSAPGSSPSRANARSRVRPPGRSNPGPPWCAPIAAAALRLLVPVSARRARRGTALDRLLPRGPFGDGYYGQTIKMLVYLAMAGDYWNPVA